MEEFKLDTSKANVVPRFLKPDKNGFSLSNRPHLKVDDLDGEGTAKDTVKARPSYRTKLYKKAGKSIAVMEEWIAFVNKKKEKKILDSQ